MSLQDAKAPGNTSGLKKLKKDLDSDNGAGQIILWSFWAIVLAYDLWVNYAHMGLWLASEWVFGIWIFTGALCVPVSVWLGKRLLLASLVINLFITVYITVGFIANLDVLYAAANVGYHPAYGPTSAQGSIPWGIRIGFMIFHAVYLINLTQRQILEKQRFSK